VPAAQNPQIATFEGVSDSLIGIQAGSGGCSARVTSQRGGPARLCDSGLAGRLVLRAGKVAGLVLDNLDWRAGRDHRAAGAGGPSAAAGRGWQRSPPTCNGDGRRARSGGDRQLPRLPGRHLRRRARGAHPEAAPGQLLPVVPGAAPAKRAGALAVVQQAYICGAYPAASTSWWSRLGCACPARELCGSAPVTLLARRRRKTGNGGGAFEDPELQGKVAVVTGSSRGIGLETATRLANNGASVGIVARAHRAVDDAVGSIQGAGGRAVGVPADATSLEATERVRERIESGLGAVDSSPPSPAAEVPDRPGARARRGGVALHRRRQPDRDVPDIEDVPARDDRAARRIDHDDGLVGGSYADAGRSGACAAAKASIVMLTRQVASQGRAVRRTGQLPSPPPC
jgi:hypothetical protein